MQAAINLKNYTASQRDSGDAKRTYTAGRVKHICALTSAFTGRKLKKRDFRKLWIMRINAAARANGIAYSALINGLKKAEININRKMLADLAVNDMPAFSKLVEKAQSALKS